MATVTETENIPAYSPINNMLKNLYLERKQRMQMKSKQVIACNYSLQIFEQPGHSIRSTIDSDASVIIRYLEENQDKIQGKRIIELGSGVGLIGIVCSLLGAEVVITDYEELLPIIEQNVKANTKEEHKISVSALNWGEDVSKLKPPFDYVIVSNIAIQNNSYKSILDTVAALSDFDTNILVSQKRKYQTKEMFLRGESLEQEKPKKEEVDFFSFLPETQYSRWQVTQFQPGKATAFIVKKLRGWWRNFD